MARIQGVELQDDWRVIYALTKIKGVGWSLAEEVLGSLDLDKSTRVSDLSADQISKIASKLDDHPIEGELVRQVKSNIQRLKRIGAYRGIRHSKNLPVRGQRTKSNARTKRGKRRTVGAFKKEALSKMQPGGKKENEEKGKTK